MNRLTKATASAMLLTLMAATPALAIYDPAAPIPADPSVIRIMSAPAPEVLEVRATRAEPISISIANRNLTFDQKPMVVDNTLMVPIRAVVEGAGGKVGWEGETRTVTVRLGDRSAVFVIGADEAEMNQDGVKYVRRNLIRMAKAPVLAGGRTLVAADTLTSVLGLLEQPGAPDMLNLVPAVRSLPPAQPEPSEPAAPEREWIVPGNVKEVKTNPDGTTRILVEGAQMSNGEGSLTWFAVTDSTEITVVENDTKRSGTAADLAASQKVDVRPTGPLLMSYPAQGGAAAIVIHK